MTKSTKANKTSSKKESKAKAKSKPEAENKAPVALTASRAEFDVLTGAVKAEKLAKPATANKNKWGHRMGSQADKIDNAFFADEKPKSLKQLTEATGFNKSRLSLHMSHLEGLEYAKKVGMGEYAPVA